MIAPSALELAQSNNVDLAKVIPSGENKRITYADVQSVIGTRTFKFYKEIKGSTKKVKLDMNRHRNPEVAAQQQSVAEEEPPRPAQPLPKEGTTVPAFTNPKSEIPHFWLKVRLAIDSIDNFVSELPEDKKVSMDSVLMKIAKDAILETPEFFNFRIRGRFLRAHNVWIHYKNLADPKLNRTVRMDLLNKMSYKGTEDFDTNKPTFKIIDASGTDISAIMPVLRENQVS